MELTAPLESPLEIKDLTPSYTLGMFRAPDRATRAGDDAKLWQGTNQEVAAVNGMNRRVMPMVTSPALMLVGGYSVDVALAWGPLAGYYAARETVSLEVVPVSTPRESARVTVKTAK